MLVRGAFNHLLRPGLRRDFRDEYMAYPEEYSQFLKVGTQERAEVEATTMAGLPRMVERGEGEPYTFIDPILGDVVRFTDDEFALGFIVSKRLMEDDLYNRAERSAKWLSRSARLTQEYRAAQLLDDAFTGAIFTGFNGEPLISASHSFLGTSGSWSNLIAGNPAFSQAGLQAGYDLFNTMKDQMGEPIPFRASRLIIGPADVWVAEQIYGSELDPFTNNNAINAIRKLQGKDGYVVSHFKTDANSWFMQGPDHDAHFLWRVKPTFKDWTDEGTDDALFASRQRFNVYFYDQRGWVGSNPA